MQSAISEIASADRSRHQSSPVSAGRSVSRELAAVREGCGSRVPGLSRCLERPPRTVLLIKKNPATMLDNAFLGRGTLPPPRNEV